MKNRHYLMLLFLTMLSLKNFATHIVGGEIYYDCLGGNNYRITLKAYRDCFNGIPPFDSPASVFIFNSSGTFIDSLEIPAPASVILPFPLSNPCLVPPTNICVEEAIYQVVVNLPPLAGGYNITYQRCCRNGTILNLISPGDVGSTYMAHIPDPGLAVCNSSPHYNNFPPIFLCAGVPLNFDHSATDPDGDSLYYQMCDAFTGLSPSCPILGVPGQNSGCPGIASPPPYPFVPWLAPYNGTYPMSSSPAVTVHPVTGLMTGTPNMVGQWVVAVCVSEYRNGVLLDVNKRDFQFNVVNCGIPVASIPVQQPFCFGTPSSFSQNSINAFTYHWDFGDPGTSLDTSNVFAPTWTYASLGTYTLTLIVNPNTVCTDTATLSVIVNPLPAMTNTNTATICSGGTVSIPLTSSLASTYTWVAANNPNTTGESIVVQSATTLTNTITNNSALVQTVIYTVTPTSTPQGCVGAPQTVTVTINPPPTMTSPGTATICTGGTISIPLTSNWPSTYTWIAADNSNTTGESTTIQSGSPLSNTITNNTGSIETVNYTVTPTSTPEGCTGTPQTVTVSIMPTPTMTSVSSASICSGGTVSIPLTSSLTSTYSWLASDNLNTTGESTTAQTGSPLTNTITNNTSSVQTVTYTVTPTSTPDGCVGTPQTLTVTVNPLPGMTSPNSSTICSGGILSIILTSNNTSTFTWIAVSNGNTNGESTTSQSGSPINDSIFNNTTAVQTIIYTVTPTSSPEGCVGAPQTLTVTANPAANMTSTDSATICTGGTINIPLTSNYPSPYTWIATDNLNTSGESTTLQAGSPLNNTINNNSTSIQNVNYTVTPTFFNGLCPGIPQLLSVTIIPTPTITNPVIATVCSGVALNIPLTSNVNSTYSWIAADNVNTTGESTTTQAANPLSNTIVNNTASVETVIYTVTPTSSPDGCLGTPQNITVTVNPAPTITSPPSATICSGETISIALTSDNTSTFTWIAVNNPNTTGESTTTQTGSPLSNTLISSTALVETVVYSVTPTSSPQGCVGASQTVNVSVNPASSITSPNSATICNGGAVSIPLTSTLVSSYSWVATDNLNTTGESITPQAGSPLSDLIANTSVSVQSVIYTVTPTSTTDGCVGIPQTITITVIPTPVITSLITDSICSDGTVVIPLTSNVPSVYAWIATDNVNTTGESTTSQTGSPLTNTLTNNTTSTQNVIYTVTPTSSPDGCAGTPQVVNINVFGEFTADFDFVKTPCTNQLTFYDSSAVAPFSWLWHFDDGDSSIIQNPIHTYTSAGTYDIQLIASTVNGCKDTVVVQANLAPLIPVLVSPNDTICLGNSMQLLASGGVSYTWSPSVGLSGDDIADPIASPDTSTTYTVSIITVDVFGDTCVQYQTTTVSVTNPALYSIAATTDADTLLQGQSTTIHAITDPSLTVIWQPSINLNNSGSFNPIAGPQSTTTYTVSILDSDGCPKTASVTIYVMPKECDVANVFVPNTFTPNGDGNNDVLYVRGKEIKELYFAVYNRRGELIFETTDKNKGWNGMYNGAKSDPDVFAWYLRAKCFNEDELVNKGNVTLIR
ncbi:MAG: gliding motility-associated C-terminal domain-containing protein [Bacteroidetes bacterium]|nr:gliding motility-associated C-terminal domain-containing protein [Bacteroidota bacterium]